MAKGQRFSEEEKREILAETKSNTIQEVADKHGIHYSTIYDWGKLFKNKNRRMTKPKPKTIISNTISGGEVTELKKTIIELSADLQFWQQQYLKLIKESQ